MVRKPPREWEFHLPEPLSPFGQAANPTIGSWTWYRTWSDALAEMCSQEQHFDLDTYEMEDHRSYRWGYNDEAV